MSWWAAAQRSLLSWTKRADSHRVACYSSGLGFGKVARPFALCYDVSCPSSTRHTRDSMTGAALASSHLRMIAAQRRVLMIVMMLFWDGSAANDLPRFRKPIGVIPGAANVRPQNRAEARMLQSRTKRHCNRAISSEASRALRTSFWATRLPPEGHPTPKIMNLCRVRQIFGYTQPFASGVLVVEVGVLIPSRKWLA